MLRNSVTNMRYAARYEGKCKSEILHDSRRITQFECPNLSEKLARLLRCVFSGN